MLQIWGFSTRSSLRSDRSEEILIDLVQIWRDNTRSSLRGCRSEEIAPDLVQIWGFGSRSDIGGRRSGREGRRFDWRLQIHQVGRRSEEQTIVRRAQQRFPVFGSRFICLEGWGACASPVPALSLAESAFSIWEGLQLEISPSTSAVPFQSSGQLGRCPCCSHSLAWEGHHLPRARIGALILIYLYSSLCTFWLIKWLRFWCYMCHDSVIWFSLYLY